MKKCLAALTLGTLTLSASDPSASRAVLKHREHNGIGYDTGYTTGQVFIAPAWKNNIMPFFDFRGHVFDDGRFATNAGLGFRYNSGTYTWGSNVYYDYRDSKNLRPHQIGAGLEMLSKYHDIRINGYVPIADTSKERSAKFDKFEGNSAIFQRRAKAALPAVEVDFGAPLGSRCGSVNYYAGLTPYYLFEKNVNGIKLGDAFGGKGRLSLDIINRFFARADVTYDKLFQWTVQGTAGISIPLGPRDRVIKSKNFLCMARNQLPERVEIIPVQCENKRTVLSSNFVFVNNLSSSNGTIESPYPTLAMAQANSKAGDVIYVFPGSGAAYTDAFTMKNGQKLIGSGTDVTVDGFVIPAQTLGQMPLLTQTDGTSITMARDTTVAGLNVIITKTAATARDAIVLPSGGTVHFYDNRQSFAGGNTSSSDNCLNVTNSTNLTLIAYNNTFQNIQNGIVLAPTGSSTTDAAILRNTTRNAGTTGVITLEPSNTATLNASVLSNTGLKVNRFGNIPTSDSSVVNTIWSNNLIGPLGGQNSGRTLFISAHDSSSVTFKSIGNVTLSGINNNNYQLQANDASSMNLVIRDNFMASSANFAVTIRHASTGNLTADVSNNIFRNVASPIQFLTSGAPVSQTASVVVSENVIINPTTVAININQILAGTWNVDVLNNLIIHPATSGVELRTGSTGNLQGDVVGNRILNSAPTEAVFLRTTGTSTLCASVVNNSSNANAGFTNSAGTLQVESPTKNLKGVQDANFLKTPFNTSGTITYVKPGTCN